MLPVLRGHRLLSRAHDSQIPDKNLAISPDLGKISLLDHTGKLLENPNLLE